MAQFIAQRAALHNNNIKNSLRYDIFERLLILFKDRIDLTNHNSVSILLDNFLFDILSISKYMLNDRYIHNKKEQKILSEKIDNPDLKKLLIRLGTISTPKKIPSVSPSDIIIIFKSFEQYLYHGKKTSDILNLNLGRYNTNYLNILNILPKLILEVEKIQDNQIRSSIYSIIHSSICIYRQFSVKAVPDVSTITKDYNGAKTLQYNLKYYFSDKNIDIWLDSIKSLESIKHYCKLSIYSGNASSPAGGSHDTNILTDVNAILSDESKRKAIYQVSSQFSGFSDFQILIDTLYENIKLDKDFAMTPHSRLVTFTAPGMKARVIAVADWVSQTALSAIHFSMFKLLKLIPSDCTFNHKSGLQIYSDKASSFYSLDLSAATDRLPRVLQSRIIARLYTRLGYDGESIAQAWLELIDREYTTKGSAFEKVLTKVKYSVGNGMGLFSSWPTMALTHHYIVSHLCKVPSENYRLVGDDLLIKDCKISYEKYLDIMSDIGMSVNLTKTIKSESGRHTLEFARNYIIKGCPINTIRFGAVYAWIDGNITPESAIWHLRDHIDFHTVDNVFELFHSKNDIILRISLYYYLWKQNLISNDNVDYLLSKIKATKFNSTIFSEVKTITTTVADKFKSNEFKSNSFYDNLLSACVVRKEEELIRVTKFAESIALIAFAQDALIEPADRFHRRLTDASLIKYDVELTGGPMLSKRERALIKSIYESL